MYREENEPLRAARRQKLRDHEGDKKKKNELTEYLVRMGIEKWRDIVHDKDR